VDLGSGLCIFFEYSSLVIGMEYMRSIGKMKDRLLILLDLDRILSANELHNIKNITSETIEAIA
jgi:chemotaxis signal transduction protein